MEVCIKPAHRLPWRRTDSGSGGTWSTCPSRVPPSPTATRASTPTSDGYNAKKGGAQYLYLSAGRRRWRSSAPGTRCPGSTSAGPTGSRRPSTTSSTTSSTSSILTDPAVISSLLTGASSYLKTDSGFSLLDFAPEMKALTGSNLSLATLPDAAGEQHLHSRVREQPAGRELHLRAGHPAAWSTPAFYGSAAVKPAKSVTVDVYNGSGTGGLAGDAAQAFASQGYTAGQAAQLLRPVAAGAGRHPGLLRRGRRRRTRRASPTRSGP